MIGHLRGRLLNCRPPHLLLEVGGVGYELEAPMSAFYQLPEPPGELALHVHHHYQQDSQSLYGFTDQTERDLFRRLLQLKGVGPRVGLAILSTLSPAELQHTAEMQDWAVLTRVPGIGRKTAERLLFELRDETLPVSDTDAPAAASPAADAISALVALGYRAADAGRAVRALDGELAREELIRQALQQLNPRT